MTLSIIELLVLAGSFFVGGIVTEAGKWYFQEYLKNPSRTVANTIHHGIKETIAKNNKPRDDL